MNVSGEAQLNIFRHTDKTPGMSVPGAGVWACSSLPGNSHDFTGPGICISEPAGVSLLLKLPQPFQLLRTLPRPLQAHSGLFIMEKSHP